MPFYQYAPDRDAGESRSREVRRTIPFEPA
jgi:hypothetical protein